MTCWFKQLASILTMSHDVAQQFVQRNTYMDYYRQALISVVQHVFVLLRISQTMLDVVHDTLCSTCFADMICSNTYKTENGRRGCWLFVKMQHDWANPQWKLNCVWVERQMLESCASKRAVTARSCFRCRSLLVHID